MSNLENNKTPTRRCCGGGASESANLAAMLKHIDITAQNREIIDRRVIKLISKYEFYVFVFRCVHYTINGFLYASLLFVAFTSMMGGTKLESQHLYWLQLASTVLIVISERIKSSLNVGQLLQIRQITLSHMVNETWSFISFTGIYGSTYDHDVNLPSLILRIQSLDVRSLNDILRAGKDRQEATTSVGV
jgi:hypothetical protein